MSNTFNNLQNISNLTKTSSLLHGTRYAFLETSQLPLKDGKVKTLGGLLHSPQLGSTGVAGTCIMFKYTMDGLSIAGLKVLLHVGADEYSIKKEQTEEITPENATIPSCKPLEVFNERVIWNAQYYTLGLWQQVQMLYTYPVLHSVITFSSNYHYTLTHYQYHQCKHLTKFKQYASD